MSIFFGMGIKIDPIFNNLFLSEQQPTSAALYIIIFLRGTANVLFDQDSTFLKDFTPFV